jgi:predicted nucleic acid-binding protein
MNNGFGLDASSVISHLKENKTVRQTLNRELNAETKVYIPPFAYYEVKRGLVDARAIKQLHLFNELLKRCPIGKVDDAVFDAAVDIYVDLKSKGRLCDENDIYIAAFCQTYGLTLVTNNTRHFGNISGLSLVDWSVT